MMKRSKWDACIAWEKEMDVDTISKNTPYFSLPERFEISVIPPATGATARFLIRNKGSQGRGVSVYMDHHSMLGIMNVPYFEAYPIDGDTYRVPIEHIDELISVIIKELDKEVQNDGE